jgi:endonuclease YncB( thermonuclease family)
MIRQVAIALALILLAGCGPSERPKLNIKREPHFEPLPVPPAKGIYRDPATETAAGTEIVEIGAFKGSCDFRFSGINDADLISLASPKGLRNYRLAGIGIPDGVRAEAHAQIRQWLADQEVGIVVEPGDPGAEAAIYVYGCGAKSLINLELVRSGLAVVSDAPSGQRDALSKASMEALGARRGVWGAKAK